MKDRLADSRSSRGGLVLKTTKNRGGPRYRSALRCWLCEATIRGKHHRAGDAHLCSTTCRQAWADLRASLAESAKIMAPRRRRL